METSQQTSAAWDEKKQRLHLLQCFESTSMSVFPASAAAEDESRAQYHLSRLNPKYPKVPVTVFVAFHGTREDMIQCETVWNGITKAACLCLTTFSRVLNHGAVTVLGVWYIVL